MLKFIGLAIFSLTAFPAMAAQVTYICKINNKGNDYIQEQVVIGYDDATATVFAYDPLIDFFVGQPVVGKVTEDTNKKQTFTWTVPVRNSGGQITKMAYRAAIFMKDKKVYMTAKPHGYVDQFTARGACVETDERRPGP